MSNAGEMTWPTEALTAPTQPSRGFIARAVFEALGQTGARLGLVWIIVVGLAAVFAPFIASSHPIVMEDARGRVSSPMLRSLDYADYTLFAIFAGACVVLVLRRHLTWQRQILILLAIVALVLPITYHFYKEREGISYSQYREGLETGTIRWMRTTLIPFSPSDRQYDLPGGAQNLAPGRQHWFGTTPNGEDVLSGMIHACRIAVSIGFVSTGLATVIGIFVGGLMGYFVGKTDMFGMRLIEIFEAIPRLFLLITFVAFYGRNLYMMMAILGLTNWTGPARFIRAEFLRLRNQDFVQAAIACGLPIRSILFRHLLPNGLTPVLISATFGVAGAILAESTLSFLGLGLIDKPSWGRMLDQARGVGTSFHWWMAMFPGGAIFLTVFAYNLIGESLRDALDPRTSKRE